MRWQDDRMLSFSSVLVSSLASWTIPAILVPVDMRPYSVSKSMAILAVGKIRDGEVAAF